MACARASVATASRASSNRCRAFLSDGALVLDVFGEVDRPLGAERRERRGYGDSVDDLQTN